MVKGEKVTHENSGLSKREWNELMTSLNLKIKCLNTLTWLKKRPTQNFWCIH